MSHHDRDAACVGVIVIRENAEQSRNLVTVVLMDVRVLQPNVRMFIAFFWIFTCVGYK